MKQAKENSCHLLGSSVRAWGGPFAFLLAAYLLARYARYLAISTKLGTEYLVAQALFLYYLDHLSIALSTAQIATVGIPRFSHIGFVSGNGQDMRMVKEHLRF
ncbi:hypothetical protein F4825DRAFT_344057 [Nemania diffusa]|nr:hypothetical protein F4825DRAFT_344057 [Nemania diffusa]